MCSNCAGDYENPDATASVEDLEFSDYRRECHGVVRVGVWLAILGICGTVWVGAVLAFAKWVVPFFQKLQLM